MIRSLFQELLWMTQVRNSQASGFVVPRFVRLWEIAIIMMEIRVKECGRLNFPFKWIIKDYMKCAYPFFLMVIGQKKVNYEVTSAKGKMVF